MNAKMSHLTDAEVEEAIAQLEKSPLVQLGKAEYRIKYRRKQKLSQLRWFEKQGHRLASEGITLEMLEAMDDEMRCDELSGE